VKLTVDHPAIIFSIIRSILARDYEAIILKILREYVKFVCCINSK